MLYKRVELACVAFSRVEHAEQFRQFGFWLAQKVGEKKAAIILNRYVPFFLKLSTQRTQSPTELLACYSAQELRNNKKPIKFLENTGGIIISHQVKQEAADRQRINMLLAEPQDNQAKEILGRYYALLMGRLKQGKLSLRSIRLALRPAVNLLESAKLQPLPTQHDLNAYLQTSPGQKAALSGFICFLRDECQAELKLPKPGAKAELKPERRKDVEKELIALIKASSDDEQYRQQLLSTALRYFHRMPRHLAVEIAVSEKLTKTSKGEWMLLYEKKRYWLPTAIALLANKNKTK